MKEEKNQEQGALTKITKSEYVTFKLQMFFFCLLALDLTETGTVKIESTSPPATGNKILIKNYSQGKKRFGAGSFSDG